MNASSVPAILTGIFMGIVAPYALAFVLLPRLGIDIGLGESVRQVLQAFVLIAGPIVAGFIAGKLAPGERVLHGLAAGAVAAAASFAILAPHLAVYAAMIFVAGGVLGGWVSQWLAARGPGRR